MQFDEGAIYGVDHTLFPGYFDFGRDGFGPVCRSLDEALHAVKAAADDGAPAVYQQRAKDTFAHWDSSACARVYSAVLGLVEAQGPEDPVLLRTRL
ncbi:hypothetical protein [Microbacterium elymi]|uniref:Uncharacterized protein n=1 Tax=Microbacterium elymi TaxID=2909587 RepID=A0ABY5NKM1_9MICO|nr:hypothetical protein [Microbacterium elymi]UUT35720.1 hypothetical protein L2X98_21080 [Microbacterium elymi]